MQTCIFAGHGMSRGNLPRRSRYRRFILCSFPFLIPNRRRSSPPNSFGLLTMTIFMKKPPSIFYQRNACQHQGRRDEYQDKLRRTERCDKQPRAKRSAVASCPQHRLFLIKTPSPQPDMSRAIRAYNTSIFGNGGMGANLLKEKSSERRI